MKKPSQLKTDLKDIQKPIAKFIRQNQISIITGAAGSAKTHIAMHVALEYLLEKQNGYDKILLTKPVVEVGSSLGFLPGTIDEKLEPYQTSFKEILDTLLGKTAATKKTRDKIGFQPINFVRGNTTKNSIVILSEGQNATLHELITFITRLDKTSKMIIEGDLLQSDIGNKSGLRDLLKIVEKVNGIETISLGEEHQTRNKIIVDLNREYNKFRAQ